MIMIIMIILLKRILINVHVSTPNKHTVCNDVSLYYELIGTVKQHNVLYHPTTTVLTRYTSCNTPLAGRKLDLQ